MAADIATLGFNINTGGLTKGEKALNKYSSTGDKVERRTEKNAQNMGASYKMLAGIIGVVATGLAALSVGSFFSGIISETTKLETSLFKIDALIKSTGKSTLITSEELRESAASLALATLDSTRGILKAQEIMLTFKKISVESYDEVIEMALNLSAVTGQSVTAAMLQLGKALEDTTTGMSAMSRSGVSFSIQQKETAKALQASGDIMGAQRVILDELASQYGGTARAAAGGLEGAQDTLGQAIEELNLGLNASLDLNTSLIPSYNSLSDSIFYLSRNTDSLVDGAQAFATVIAMGMLSAIAKSTAATIAQTFATIAASKEALKKATATQALSLAELNLMKVQQQSLVSSLALAQTERTRSAIRAQLTANTVALTTANSAYSKSMAATAAATASAATATTALGAAVRFLTGPWGLLITAIGVAASVFMSSREESDLLKDSLANQKDAAKLLNDEYEKMTNQKATQALFGLNEGLLALLNKRYEIEKEIQGLSGGMSDAVTFTRLNKELTSVNGQIDTVNKNLNETRAVLQGRADTIFTDLLDEGKKQLKLEEELEAQRLAAEPSFTKQIESLRRLQDQIGMTADELIIYNATQAAAANDYTPEQTKAIIAQAEAYVKARKEYKAFQDEFGGQDFAPEIDLPSGSINKITSDFDSWIASIESSTGQLEKLEEEIVNVWLAMDAGDIDMESGLEYIEQIEDKIKGLESGPGNPFEEMIKGANDTASAVSGMFESGSKDAKKMAVAMAALNLIAGVGAILTQGKGDPYSAFGRMAAMASMVASLGVAVGSLSSGYDDVAGDRQESQGLTIWGDKSESISNSIDITADATSELVGINKGMLNALTSLQTGIASVSSMATRGLTDISLSGSDLGIIDFAKFIADPMEMIGLGFLGDFIGKGIGKLFGGSSKTVDSGISFSGSLTGDADVMGYQTTQYKKWKWGSKKTREDFYDLGDDINTQFGLALMGIADSVAEGAMALGFSTDYITDKINAFEVESQKISLKGLSAEEQAAEIEAVFSSIFDNVAGEVIPFLGDFQQVGEGLAETLVRVATQVQITEVLADKLGVTIADKLSDPQMFAQIADNLSTLVGGIEEFASKTSSFIDSFAPEAVKFDIALDALTDSLTGVGLVVPDSAEGFWELMQGIDGTTEAGQAQIAALLNIQGVASDYYDLLSDRESEKLAEEQARQSEVDSFNSSLKSLVGSIDSTIEAMLGINKNTEMANRDLDVALAAARGGNFNPAMNLNLSALSNSTEGYSSATDFAIAQAVTANKLQDLADLAGNTATYEDMLLSANENQVDLLASIDSNLSNDQAVKSDNNENIITELRESNKKLANALDKSNDLIMAQNRLQAETADGIDRLVNNGVEIIA